MTRLPVGMIILIAVSALIFFGLAQRALDRMKLSDKGALAVIAALIIGSFIDIPVRGGANPITLNLGGHWFPWCWPFTWWPRPEPRLRSSGPWPAPPSPPW